MFLAGASDMAVAKASEADIRYPVIARIPGGEHTCFPDVRILTCYVPRLFEMGVYVGMELTDSDGRRWVARSAYATDHQAPKRWWHVWPLSPTRWKQLELDLETIEPATFAEILTSVSAHMEEEWRDSLEKDGDPEEIAETRAELHAAKDVAGIYEALGFEFEPGFWWARR